MEHTGKVYCITNKKTGKKYVGATSYPLKYRMSGHYTPKARGIYISSLLQSTPREDWTWEILEDGLDKEQLRIREEHWIRKLNTVEDGYNKCYGSISGTRVKKIISIWHFRHGRFDGEIDEVVKHLRLKNRNSIYSLCTGKKMQHNGWVLYENKDMDIKCKYKELFM